MKKVIAALTIAGSIFSTAANAVSATSTLNISATVPNSCTLATGSNAADMALGSIAPDTQAVSATATTISFTCTNGTSYSVTADDGVNSVTAGARRMKGLVATNFLDYTLLQGTTGNVAFANLTDQTADGTQKDLSFRISVPAAATGTYRTADTYSDTVTLSIAY
ncbi:Csu type fimbrial protein [Sphingomonas nostoxanthinifaciens]|uniref:Csu type fimbrial protein n=1 Tax=Sphingomonas nostoxanthinifaciens TaxID=2872652 RepID=UPI001CC1CFB0|nr:spore coat protein U domain-containing protein [Sphingomonas nostoxanthinifaciens]UAK22988.1 spore coat U domain-containing protein [Sphingomonas nostoxanthinifaciens]